MPPEILADLALSRVSIYAAITQVGRVAHAHADDGT